MIETYKHSGEGYNPFLIGSKWQIAQLNYSLDEALESKNRLDIHHKTDEAFLLIDGEAILIAAKIDKDLISYDMQKMIPGIVCNIPKKVWHNIVLEPGAKVLIVEDMNTHLPLPEGDYDFHYFTDEQKSDFRNQITNLNR
ncbi:MAG: hypothetical protein PF489_07390 [Salinivirgaceae bacterium]|jgi:mannose-6-phosphate isomerase-like protein (cupin superfamily)|nr:hypothetical protein [Salinivirgaceae bacterium]